MFFEKVSLVTGGIDPLHSGHISYFKRAKDLSNYLVVGLNTEEWLTHKKGQYFQSWVERAEIIRHLEMVDAVISWEDDEQGSACGAIEKCLDIAEKVIFCNGGDRGKENTPELDTIVRAMTLGGDTALYQKLKLVKETRDENPGGPYKKILRESHGMVI